MLLDDVMPVYQFQVVRSTLVRAGPEPIFRAIRETKAADIPVFILLFWLRELPGRLAGRGRRYFSGGRTLFEQAVDDLGFIVLAEETDREVVLGAVAQWWTLFGARFYRVRDAEEFLRVDPAGYAKAAGNFRVEMDTAGGWSTLRHETRIYASDPATRKKFALYWWFIYPGVALIRRMWLRSIKRRAEAGELS
ncbi:MAG TPA: hypothetical protein VGK88_13515 [bacterium]